MAIWPIALWPRGHPSESDLVELILFAVRLEAGIEKMRAITQACSGHEGGVHLAKERLDHVHSSAEKVRSAGECGRADGFQERALRYLCVDKVVETLVGDCVWRVYYQQVVSDNHPEHDLADASKYSEMHFPINTVLGLTSEKKNN